MGARHTTFARSALPPRQDNVVKIVCNLRDSADQGRDNDVRLCHRGRLKMQQAHATVRRSRSPTESSGRCDSPATPKTLIEALHTRDAKFFHARHKEPLVKSPERHPKPSAAKAGEKCSSRIRTEASSPSATMHGNMEMVDSTSGLPRNLVQVESLTPVYS